MTDTYRLFNIDYDAGLRFSFISTGSIDIIKVVDYSIVAVKSNVIKANPIFNFGFGDFDYESGTVKDEVKSANGDARKVFYTALETIPIFFQKYPNAAIMITGSDSKHNFQERCFLTCKKKCKASGFCRNKH